MQEFMLTVHHQMRLSSAFEVINHLLSMLLIISTAGVALLLWTRGALGIGAVAAATAMALRLNGISHWVMWEMSSLFEHIGTVQDGMNTLSRERRVPDRPDAVPLAVTRGEVRFEQVGFSYGGSKTVIDGLNLHIRPGEKIGLVGRSGAGKSTISTLVPRLYDVTSGSISVNGINIRDVKLEELRSRIGVVTQDSHMFHESIESNLRYAKESATHNEMLEACDAAQIGDFIRSLPNGLETIVGERGHRLSGGEKQRLAIARLLLKAPDIVILDEATAHLDSENEALVQQALKVALANRTSIVIAHRLSTIVSADQILVLENGEIVERGRHEELVALGGLYFELFQRQSMGLTE
jgi:ATP-binding cassette subfamily B multidrug efflux pump